MTDESTPLCYMMPHEQLYQLLLVADDAREFAAELLARHDNELGRSTIKNSYWATHLEQRMAAARQIIEDLTPELAHMNSLASPSVIPVPGSQTPQ